jgi:hypothetical protein
VILNVFFHDEWRYAETWHGMEALIISVLSTMAAGSEIASLGFSDRRHTGHHGPDNNLRVAINRETGHGGLVWFLDRDSPKQGGIFDHVWVSNNPEPPERIRKLPPPHGRRSTLTEKAFCRSPGFAPPWRNSAGPGRATARKRSTGSMAT